MQSRKFILAAIPVLVVLLASTSPAKDYRYYDDRYYNQDDRYEHGNYYNNDRDDNRYDNRYDDRYNNRYDDRDDRHRDRHEPRKARAGWDIDSREARDAANCYHYSLYAENGRGSARISSLPGKNYIQVTNGEKSGYVCFDRGGTLELGKLANPGIFVEFRLERFGTFSFGPGQRGSEYAHNWYRSYYGL